MPPRHLVVVPHTHWDREWYRTHQEFRYRLVRLVDKLLGILEGDPTFRHFMLDGQAIVVDDYLEVRPGARERLAKLVRDGRLMAGPWFVLPDEWLVSGEALIRNLRLGMRKAESLGGVMRLGYVPDQFGHVGQLPQIFAGFGFDAAVLWRGVGADVTKNLFHWEAPDGSRLLVVYLPNGYGNAANLPVDPEALAARLRQSRAALEPFACTQSLLLMNGSDHLEPQPGLPAALERAAALLGDGTTVEIGTLPGYVARAKAEAPAELELHRGELRSALRAHLLPGCASARAPQKRAEFANDTLLTSVVEPLAAWLGALGGDGDPEMIDLAWRIALENHPHDSVCGCSIDRVHDEMDTRFRRVEEILNAHLRRVAGELGQRISSPLMPGTGESLWVWNPNGAGRFLVESVVELDLPTRGGSRVGTFHLRGADGRRIPVAAELVAPEQEIFSIRLPRAIAPLIFEGFGGEIAGHSLRALELEKKDGTLHARILVSEWPSDFDVAGARARLEKALTDPGVEHLALEIVRTPRVRLRFADDLPGHGVRTYRVARGRAQDAEKAGVRTGSIQMGGVFLENEHWRVEVAPEGLVRLVRRDGPIIEDAIRLVSEGDRGDEYNFDPVVGGEVVERPERVRVHVETPGEGEVAARIDARYRVPYGLAPDRKSRSDKRVALDVTLRIALHAGLDRIDVAFECDNTARDHRLRLHARAPFVARRFEVESAFEVAERPIAPKPGDFGSERPAEFPVGAVPQRSFASIDDGATALTVANRGAAEVEAVPEPDGTTSLAVTLLRACGWLSRPDLGLRPNHAGPPIETPGAQVPGRQRQELSIRLHSSGEPQRALQAHAFARPPVAFPGGSPDGAPLADGARLVEVDDPAVLVSAVEPRFDGRAVLRIWNASGAAREARVAWKPAGASALEAVDLLERPDPKSPPAGGPSVNARLRPWQIATFRVR